MTVPLWILAATSVVSTILLWLQGRESKSIAFRATEFLQERLRASDAEREKLLFRIQQWSPPEPERSTPVKPQSQEAVIRELQQPKEYADSDLALRGLVRNGDGRVVEESTGRMWDSPDDLDKWLAFKAARQLPDDADPADYQGFIE